jgi:integrase/recombinase XerD
MTEMPQSCEEFARERLANRAIKDSTYREYMATLRALNLTDVPYEWATLAMLTSRLQRVINPGTRRKHAINLRATLGVKVPCPRAVQKVYILPDNDVLHEALAASAYAMYGFSMLYAGMRLGESCIKQPQNQSILNIDRQRRADGTITAAKTIGPVYVPQWFADAYKDFKPHHATNTVYIGIRRACKKTGITLNPHMLRHAFATNLVNAGATPEVLRRQMRHHDVAVSLRYYVQTTEADITKVVNAIGGDR